MAETDIVGEARAMQQRIDELAATSNDMHEHLYPETLPGRLADEITRLHARIEELEARLEVDHHFKLGPDGELVRVEISAGERAGFPDGIECRDCTIQLMKEHIDDLTRERDEAREGLMIIAGKKQCVDNLMSNVDIARAALGEKS